MRIGELAEAAGVDPRTIRFYESVGVLPDPRRRPSGYRDYGAEDLERLRLVRAAQSPGFTLCEIAEIMAWRERGELPCAHVRGLVDSHTGTIEGLVEDLGLLCTELARLARRRRRSVSARIETAPVTASRTATAAELVAGSLRGGLARSAWRGRTGRPAAGRRHTR